MSKKSFQKYLFEEKMKKSNPTLNIFNSSLYTQGKNTKKRIIDNEIGYKTINSSYINLLNTKRKIYIKYKLLVHLKTKINYLFQRQ